jgi:hypothetical protein
MIRARADILRGGLGRLVSPFKRLVLTTTSMSKMYRDPQGD